MKNITVLGIDLAKDVFQLHGVNEHGKKIFGKRVTRTTPPTLIAHFNLDTQATLLRLHITM